MFTVYGLAICFVSIASIRPYPKHILHSWGEGGAAPKAPLGIILREICCFRIGVLLEKVEGNKRLVTHITINFMGENRIPNILGYYKDRTILGNIEIGKLLGNRLVICLGNTQAGSYWFKLVPENCY